MLLAEEFVLLALDTDGRPAHGTLNQPAAAVGVTGALVTELVQEGHVSIDDGRIRLTGTRPSCGLLAQVLDSLAAHEGKKLKSRLGSVKHSGWAEVVDAMVASGVVGREKEPLRPTRHPVTDKAAHAALLAEVRAAAAGDGSNGAADRHAPGAGRAEPAARGRGPGPIGPCQGQEADRGGRRAGSRQPPQ